MHEKPLWTIVAVQWQENKKAKRDGSKGIGIWLILMVIMQFCLGILGIANIKEYDKKVRFMFKNSIFEKATHQLRSENTHIH